MKLEHSFTVPVGIDEAWRILLDIERIGPCMPGAAIESVDGDDFTGSVKVRLGPIGLTYKGKASFIEKDEAAHRAIIDARGRDARGNGTASAKVTATLADEGGSTKVLVNTDLDITGKPAQFGRGVMVDVGNKLIGQFADNLAQTIESGDDGGAGSAATTPPAKKAAAPAKKTAPRKRTPSPKPAKAASAGTAAPTPAAPGDPATNPLVDEAALETTAAAPAAYSAPGATAGSEAGAQAGSEASAVNGHSSRPAQRPQREVEPINLIESAGPAVAKRLAPVAIGLVLVLGAWRYRRRKR